MMRRTPARTHLLWRAARTDTPAGSGIGGSMPLFSGGQIGQQQGAGTNSHDILVPIRGMEHVLPAEAINRPLNTSSLTVA